MAAVIAAATMLGSCTSSSPATGHALRAEGPPAVGLLGLPKARIGETYRFAFPLFVNTSRTTVRITSFHLDNVPAGAQVTGYALYSMKETNGYILESRDSDRDTPGSPNPAKHPDHAGKPIAIKSHGDSGDYYAMVKVKVVGHITKHLSGCRVNYTQGGDQYTQTVQCEYALDMK
ncbi:hypothetical protein OOK27_22020 [Streptomyces canus]|uniref:hypothetical protein n=1 Tax=Streptomyces canus TaxID=58343 RepID=UPI0022540301|nr:hypothetical protein [Streptomyces canus]MCX5256779.1 hypothetical protein [Streptomyces canus]